MNNDPHREWVDEADTDAPPRKLIYPRAQVLRAEFDAYANVLRAEIAKQGGAMPEALPPLPGDGI